jgi:hypothetical protein
MVEGGRMTAPVSRPAARLGRFGRLWWLPAGGYGNGLDDQAWAPALQVSGQVVPQLLSTLRQAAVPAYAARLRDPRDRGWQPESYQLWVGASAYGRAEAVLLAVMPRLSREAAGRADAAWR